MRLSFFFEGPRCSWVAQAENYPREFDGIHVNLPSRKGVQARPVPVFASIHEKRNRRSVANLPNLHKLNESGTFSSRLIVCDQESAVYLFFPLTRKIQERL